MNYSGIIAENRARLAIIRSPYNPITGEGSDCIPRRRVEMVDAPIPIMFLPIQVIENPLVAAILEAGGIQAFLLINGHEPSRENVAQVWEKVEQVRINWDFEYWAVLGAMIKDKNSGDDIPFILNRGQRKLLRELMTMFLANLPIRVIIVKARQWGGSTLVQIFMAWLQLVHLRQWNSIIAAHVENTARLVQGMYTKMLASYPLHWAGVEKPLELKPFERSTKTRFVKERGCKITIGSAEKPESIRGGDEAMAHLTEVASWAATAGKTPEDLTQSVVSGIRLLPKTMIVYESTAKGVGNFFHREWLRAKQPGAIFRPVFVAFFEIDDYSAHIVNYKEFIDSITPQEWAYWEAGATLEAIMWRRNKAKEYSDEWRFISEYPGNDEEAFQSTGRRFYPIHDVSRLRKGCLPHPAFIGELHGKADSGPDSMVGLKFAPIERGNFKVWHMPGLETCTDRYVVVVDIGGRSDAADNSVIAVFDRIEMLRGGVPEVSAEWAGHIDHDKLAWLGVMIATVYHNALLVIEANTLETAETEGDHFEYILDEVAMYYDNLFSRTPPDKIKQGQPARWGFHTNRSSKQMVCDHQKKALREDLYIENSPECCDEHDTFEIKENGSLGAVQGCRDDRHITRAIGVWVCYQYLPPPVMIDKTNNSKITRKIVGASSF